jgi:hypothetical protein
MIHSPRAMITVTWNRGGFHVIAVLPEGQKFDTDYYTREILQKIPDWRSQQPGRRDPKVLVHADTARPQRARLSLDFFEENWMEKARDPLHSCNLEP